MVVKTIISAVLGYLLGSISFAVLLSRWFMRRDIRKYGSHNAGATNVARVFGFKFGFLTFLCDFAKTALSMFLGRLIGGEWGFLLAGMFCMIGHCFPLFFSFRGGKAVTVGSAFGFFIDWRIFAMIFVVFFIVVLTTKIVSLASVSGAAFFPIAQIIIGERDPKRLILGCVAAALVIFMHRTNIKRLLRGEEAKFKFGRKGADKNDQKS